MRLKVLLLSLVLMVVSACNSSSSVEGQQSPAQKADPSRLCVPESELLAGNIIGGELVPQTAADSKLVFMLLSGGLLCTATAISKNIVLTAAHCIASGAEATFVSFYTSVSCESGYNKKKYVQKVSQIFVHEAYNPNAQPDVMTGDIALVVLEKDIPEGYAIHKIANPDNLAETSNMLLYGYGRTSSDSTPSGAGFLRKALMGRNEFNVRYADKKIEVNQSAGRGICQGDSGGPSFVDIGKEKQVLGINSYVVGPSEAKVCDGFSYQTLAFAYIDWIKSKIDLVAISK